MPLPIPNLDDRSFDDLMKEAKSLIPIYDKEWTNHNPSDPGITLLELFAWLCEMIIYRINQVPEENYRRFLKLIGIEYLFNWNLVPGTDDSRLRDFLVQNYDARWVRGAKIEKDDDKKTITLSAGADSLVLKLNDNDQEHQVVTMTFADGRTYEFVVKMDDDQLKVYESIERDVRRGVNAINQRYRAITSDDFEFLALECMEYLQKGLAGRAMCMNNRDLEYQKEEDSFDPQAGHVSVVIIPRGEGYVFTWEKVFKGLEKDVEEEELILREFLMQIYDADWVRDSIIEKSEDGKTLSISQPASPDSNIISNITLELKDEEKKVIMTSTIYGSNNYELMVETIVIIPKTEKHEKCVFTWEKVPGKDELREDEQILCEYLMQIYNADWIREAIIEKNVDGKTLSISQPASPDSSNISKITLELKDEEKKVIITSNIEGMKPDLIVDGKKVKGYCAGENEPSALLIDQVKKYLDQRRLITTRVHVVAPDYQQVRLTVNVVLKENTVEGTVIADAINRIKTYFSPFEGGQAGKGWPLGRRVYPSEIYYLLEGITGVDHVESVKIEIKGEIIKPHQLVSITLDVQVS